MTRISSDKAVLFEKVGASPGLEVRVMTDASPRRHPIQRGADAADSQALPLMGSVWETFCSFRLPAGVTNRRYGVLTGMMIL